MVFDGRQLFWSEVVGNQSLPQCDWALGVALDVWVIDFKVSLWKVCQTVCR